MNKQPFGRRALALFLSVICVVGLIPPQAFAAGGSIAPDEIVLLKADYATGAYSPGGSDNGLEQYYAPNGLDEVTVHNFRMTVGDETITGFCGDHTATMGNRFNGDTWGNRAPVSENLYPLLAYYYWSCNYDPTFNNGASGWANQVTNTYIQCVVWLDKMGRLPDYHTDRAGWIAAVAEQRQAAYDHYNQPNPSAWSHEFDAGFRLDEYEAGNYYKDWEFWEYYYTGDNDTETPQPIIIGLRDESVSETFFIQKVDTLGNNVSGVTFLVESENGAFRTSVTTNSSGIAQFASDTGNGWYTITETNAPSDYERNTIPVRVYLTANVTGTIYLANTKIITDPGELKIRKVDIDDPTKGIAGAVIKLTHPASGRTSTFTSGADGWVVIPQAFVDEMLTGLWEAEEITPPAGYRLNPDPNVTKQAFIWDGGRTPISLVFTNDSDVKIKFRKVDADNPTRGLAGATIAIYKDGTPITTAVTDSQGYITMNGVTEGYYVFKELNPPVGYALDVDPYVGVYIDPAQIAGNETIEVTMVNHRTPTLRIQKVDVETGLGVANTRFSVVGMNNDYSNIVTTDADGWAVLDDVDAAVYEITELSVPAPYILDTNNRRTVALRAGEDHSISFANGKEPGLRIVKKDLITGNAVPGVTFRIEKIDGSYSTELTTDANGEVFFDHIAAGSYRVQEIAVPGDYLLSDEIKTVNLEANKTTTLEFYNSKRPGLRIIKRDATTDAFVAGVTFRIEKIDGTYSTELTTDASGEVYIPNLAAGAYRVQEIAVPGNYILDDTTKTVTLEADRTAILEFRNYQRPGLLIKKTSSDGQNLEGVHFSVKVKEGAAIGDFITDANGEVFIPNLTAGWYTITETYVPEGYILDSTPHDVLLEAGASGDGKVYQTYSLVNHAKPKLEIYKVDSVVGGSVAGAKFQITFAGENQNGSVRDLGVHDSDANGEIKLENLDVGWYRIKEISAPDGYQLNSAEQTIYLQADDAKSVTFENTPLNAIIVLKRDSVSGEPVEGCTFQLRYLSGTSGTGGTVIDTATTSNTGTAIWTLLQAGTYIVEVRP